MKKLITLLVIFVVAFSSVLPVYAADGKVTYSGNAGNFVFEPGSEHSLTDLFPNFKGVMPGDTLTQKITVKNDADNKVKGYSDFIESRIFIFLILADTFSYFYRIGIRCYFTLTSI